MNLIKQLKLSDEEALKLLIDRHSMDVYHLAFGLLKNSYESEDVVQEVFLNFWNYRFQLHEESKLKNLLLVITKRICLNKLRTAYVKAIKIDYDDSNAFCETIVYDDYSTKEIISIEDDAVSKLPLKQREVYLLSRKEGKSYNEIAEELNISPNTVRNHMVQALKYMKLIFRKVGYYSFFLF